MTRSSTSSYSTHDDAAWGTSRDRASGWPRFENLGIATTLLVAGGSVLAYVIQSALFAPFEVSLQDIGMSPISMLLRSSYLVLIAMFFGAFLLPIAGGGIRWLWHVCQGVLSRRQMVYGIIALLVLGIAVNADPTVSQTVGISGNSGQENFWFVVFVCVVLALLWLLIETATRNVALANVTCLVATLAITSFFAWTTMEPASGSYKDHGTYSLPLLAAGFDPTPANVRWVDPSISPLPSDRPGGRQFGCMFMLYSEGDKYTFYDPLNSSTYLAKSGDVSVEVVDESSLEESADLRPGSCAVVSQNDSPVFD